MEPIINPWIFYLIGLVEPLHFAGIMSLVALMFVVAFIYLETPAGESLKTLKAWRNGLIMLCLISLLIPTKDTIYKMIAADAITPDNLKTVTDMAKKFKNSAKEDIIDIIKEIKE